MCVCMYVPATESTQGSSYKFPQKMGVITVILTFTIYQGRLWCDEFFQYSSSYI